MTFEQAMALKIGLANQGATPNDCIAALESLADRLTPGHRVSLDADLADLRQFGNEWPVRCRTIAGADAYEFPDGRRVFLSSLLPPADWHTPETRFDLGADDA